MECEAPHLSLLGPKILETHAFQTGEAFEPRIAVRESLHVRKPPISVNHSSSVLLALPGVVDIDMYISDIPHAARNQGIRCGTHIGLCHLIGKMIPTVPAHKRCCRSPTALCG